MNDWTNDDIDFYQWLKTQKLLPMEILVAQIIYALIQGVKRKVPIQEWTRENIVEFVKRGRDD